MELSVTTPLQRQVGLIPFHLADYASIYRAQLQAANQVADNLSKELLFLGSHQHVITLGRRSQRSHVESPKTSPVAVYRIERGGEATYHGPGQLVGYPILSLDGRPATPRDLHLLLRQIETLIIESLALVGIPAERKPGYTGVWVAGGERKIAAIGIAVKRWVTYHGFAINVNTDLNYFRLLTPYGGACGLNTEVMTSVERELGHAISMRQMQQAVVKVFAEIFKVQLVHGPADAFALSTLPKAAAVPIGK